MLFRKNYLIICLAVFSFNSFAQRGIDGNRIVNVVSTIVNEYTTLISDATAGATFITVAASGLNANTRFGAGNNLAAGDLIMIIQMQGATILGAPDSGVPTIGFPNDATWGSVTNYNNCGRYEFAQVSSVPNATTINIDCGLTYSYTATGKTQIIRIPRYNNLTITSPGVLTCQLWNGTSGGVVAVEVLANTTINAGASIDASAQGFRGGALFTTTGRTTTTLYSCVSLDVGTNKGEGIAGYDADYTPYGGKYCRGAAANAGGGANVWNCGGGGGGNAGNIASWTGQGNPDLSGAGWATAWNLESAGFAASTSSGGGRGGYSFASSDQNAITLGPGTPGFSNAWGGSYRYNLGGLGGRPLDYSTGRIFMGGGGGAGEQDNGRGTAGGRGGGIVYLMNYGTVSGTGTIISNGANGANTPNSAFNPGVDGAGGAGGAGAIIINSIGIISGISTNVNGGAGGNQVVNFGVTESEGPGGGGGGGYTALSNGVITQTSNGGANGTTNCASLSEFLPNGATKGAAGITNQLISADTINVSNVTICAGNTATLTATLYGTIPATITWYSAAIGGTVLGTGSTFTTPVLASTTIYYVGFCPGTYTKPVTVTVNPGLLITVNSPTICPGGTASLIASGGTTYAWSAGATSTGVNTANASPAITTTYTVSGTTAGCSGTAVSTVTVNSLPVVTVNSPTICAGQTANLTAGGATTYAWSAGTTSTGVNTATATPVITTSYTVTGTTAGCVNTAVSTVTVTTTADATITYVPPVCIGFSAFNMTAATSGGLWTGTGITNGAAGTFDPTSSGVGSFIITYTITGACGGTDTALVTVTNNLNSTINNVSPFCLGSLPFNLTAATSGGTWSGTGITNTGTGTFTPSSAGVGTFIITYTISGSCGSTDTSIVTVVPNSDATIVQPGPLCNLGSPINLTAATSGGTWSGTGITSSSAGTFNPVTAGVGSFVITYSIGGSCGSSDTATVTVVPTSNATITPVTSICVGASAFNLSATDPGGIWTGTGITDSVNGIFNPATAGIGSFIVTYTISGMCGATDTAIVNVTSLLNATINAQAPLCAGSSPVNLTAATSGGTWTGTGITSGSAGTFNPGIGVGTYIITYTIGGSCGNSDTISITVTPPNTVSITAISPVCLNTTPFNFSALPAGGAWSGTGITSSFAGTFDPAVSGAGTFIITYGISGVCGDTTTQSIIVNPLPTPNFTSDISSGCPPLCVQFTESITNSCNTMIYNFGDGNTSTSSTATNCYINAGIYDVNITCTDGNNCIGTTTIPNMINVIALPLADFTFTPFPVAPSNITVSFTDASTNSNSWLWNFGDIGSGSNTSVSTNPTHIYSAEGNYCITLVASNVSGCSDTTINCIVIANDAVFLIPNVFTPNGDLNNDEFFITTTSTKQLTCTIYDRWGLKLYEWDAVTGGWDGHTSSGSVAPSGVYYYIMSAIGNNDKVTKLQGFIQLLNN